LTRKCLLANGLSSEILVPKLGFPTHVGAIGLWVSLQPVEIAEALPGLECRLELGAASIIGFAAGVLCQLFESFFCFRMRRLGMIVQVEGLDNFCDKRGEGGLGCLGMGRETQIPEGLGGDGPYGDSLNLLWKAEARYLE